MRDWLRAVTVAGVLANGCGGSDGKDCDRYATITCENTRSVPSAAATRVWTRTRRLFSR